MEQDNTINEVADGATQEQQVIETPTASAEDNGQVEQQQPEPVEKEEPKAEEEIKPEDKPDEKEESEDEKTDKDNAGDKPEKTFTGHEVNDIVKDRLAKIYSKYGATNSEELDKMIGESQAYEVTVEENKSLQQENAMLKSQITLMKSGVDEGRYDDVKAILGVKKLDVTEDNLKKEIASHPEWLKQNSVRVIAGLGSPKADNENVSQSDKDYAEKAFGIKFVD